MFIHFLGKSHITKHQREKKLNSLKIYLHLVSCSNRTTTLRRAWYYRRTKQEIHDTYNVTSRRVHETTVPVEKQPVLHISVCVRSRARVYVYVRACVCGCTGEGVYWRACSLINPSCHASPYCHSGPLSPRHFRHYLTNGMIPGKTLLYIKCASWFSPQLLFKIVIVLEEFSEILP